MGSIRKMMAAMFMSLTFVAFQSEVSAQTSRNVSRTATSTSRQAGSSSNVKKSTPVRQTATKPSSQVRPGGSGKSSSTTVSRPSRNNAVRAGNSGISSDRKPSTTVSRPSSQTKPAVSKPATKPSTQNKPAVTRPSTPNRQPVTRPSTRPSDSKSPSFKPGNQDKPTTVTRPGRQTDRPSDRPSSTNPSVRPDKGPDKGQGNNRPADRPGNGKKPDMRPGDRPGNGPGYGPGHPVQVRPDHKPHGPRVHPRDRDFMAWNAPAHFWTSHHHCYGHRVRVLPRDVMRYMFHGVTYYCYDDIWYRPYGGHYVVCRPPFGTVLAANVIADMTWAAVNMAYYYTIAQTYDQINDNNEYIAEQNALIAQNNAIIAAQNAQISQNQNLAQESYALANELGLVQSYAAASTEYFYQDGVFYVKDADGEYKVIVPPAGALVESLPEDYDMVTLKDGKEYYKVDDTIYKVTIVDGKPYFEVLGQLFS